MHQIRKRLTFANVLSITAVFIALGGTAWALSKNSVGSKQIKTNAVKSGEIAAGAVGSEEVADGSLQDNDFGAGQLPPGAQGPIGPTGPGGPQGIAGPGARWALVAGDGTIVKQSGGIAVSTAVGSPNTFRVDFGVPTSGKAYWVTLHTGATASAPTVTPCQAPGGAETDAQTCDPNISIGTANQVEVFATGSGSAPLFYTAMVP